MRFFTHTIRSLSLFWAFLLVVLSGGCFLLDFHDEANSVLNPLPVGNAAVRFNLVIPNRANVLPVIRAAGSSAEVLFRVTVLLPGESSNPSVTFIKRATVGDDGSATVTFSGLPEGAAIGEINIDGGTIGGKSMFHGAADLFPGENELTVSPKGSLHESDILANTLLAIAANPDLIKISKPNLVTNAANLAASLLTNPQGDVYALVYQTVTASSIAFDSSKYTQIDISAPDGSMRAMGMNTWVVGPETFWSQTSFSGMKPTGVLRHGIGDYAFVEWATLDGSSKAFTRVMTGNGGLDCYLMTSSSSGFIPNSGKAFLGDNSLVIAGFSSGKPALIRWNGKENSSVENDVNGAGILWKTYFDVASTEAASATINYLEFDSAGTGKILCSIKDPILGQRLFEVDPATGLAVEKQVENRFGLWAQVSSGAVTLGWDKLEAASYKVYYATGTVLATATSPVLSATANVQMVEGLVNKQVYTFQVAAIASEGNALAWSTQIQATPIGAEEPIVYANWKLATNSYEIGSTALENVRILSYDPDGMMLKLEVTGTSPLTTGSILVGVYENKPLCVKLPFMGMQPPGGGTLPPGATPPPGGTTVPTTTTMVYDLVVTPATMAEIFESCKYVYRGKMSQLSVLSENLISTNDPLYSNKIAYLRKSPRAAIRAGFTSPITASPSYGALSLEMENFELDPDVVVDFETSFGRIVQFDLRVDGYVQCEIYAKFVASAGAALPIIEGTLLPHQEIPFFIGPVPGTWAREVNATWNISINADVEVKAGTKMRVDFRSGVNYFNETGWGGQLLWKIRNTPLLEAKLTGTFSNEAAIEMKNAVKVGGLAGPELTLKPYIKSEAKVSSEKPCEVNAALTVGLQGELKAIVQAWSYNIGEWGSSFEPFGPWTIASATVSANATPTLHLTGPYNLENQLKLYWPDQLINKMVPHVVTTGTESFVLSMDDSKGLYRGISKVEVSVDGNPAFLTFNYDQLESDSNPELATLTLEFPVIITDKLKSIQENSEYVGWYTPFRLNPGPHELEFKVTDRCGDSSIATHAIWIKAEENPWQVKYNDGVTKAWEVAFTSCERGNLPERTRTIEPESGAFNIAPVFDGTIKNYYESGDLKLEGEFTQGIRTGTWKRNHDPASPQYYTQVTFDSAGSLSKWVYIDLYSQDRDLYFEVNPANGSLDAGVVTTDLSYLDQDLMLTNLVSGERTIGKEGITAGPFHNDTLTNGQRNGPANHKTSLEEASGEYLANLMDEQWTFTNASTNTTSSLTYSENKLSGAFSVTGPDLSITGSFVEDVKTGSWQITNGNESISASYVDGKHDGSYSRTYTLNGALVYYSGSYIAGVSQNTPWKVLRVSDNKQVATITSHIANDTINTASYQPGIPDVTELLNPQLQWSYLFASP